MKMKRFLASCALVTIAQVLVHAADPQLSQQATGTAENANPFAPGTYELEVVAGPFFYSQFLLHNAPAADMAVGTVRLGLMLTRPRELGFLSGNIEAVGEVFGGPFFTGPSGVQVGTTLLFRYNFVQPQTRFAPYIQGGGGTVYTSISGHESRDLVSAPVEFNLQGAVGVRYRLDQHWSLVLELGYRHISNAGLKEPNYGINNFGGDVGVGYSF